MPAHCEREATTQPPKDGSPLWGRAIFGCDFIARPRRSAAATPSSSLFVSLENRLGQMVTLFLSGPLLLAGPGGSLLHGLIDAGPEQETDDDARAYTSHDSSSSSHRIAVGWTTGA